MDEKYIIQLRKDLDDALRLIGKLALQNIRQDKKIVELESKINLLIKLNEENEKEISNLSFDSDVRAIDNWTNRS